MTNLKFGLFMPPLHPAGENPTLALERDLDLIDIADRLGYDEAWIGEHHSAGSEIVGAPELLVATAAARTKRIKLGTGVTSVSYHNPLWVAERMVLLDHLTRGRSMLGVGPGSLPTDSAMIGLTPTDTRELLETNLDIIMRLLAGEAVTEKTLTHNLVDARLQLRPYSDPCFDVVTAAMVSPTGPRLAGRFGVGMLSIGATMTQTGFDALAHHWNVVEERAAHFGRPAPNRAGWRLVGPMHIAETREQACREVEHGITPWFRYFQQVAAFPQMVAEGRNVQEMVEFVNKAGIGAIGTPDDALAQIERLVEQSGGFGTMLLLAHEWADSAATMRSYELIARHVMPHFQGSVRSHTQSSVDAQTRAIQTRQAHTQAHTQALVHMTQKYAKELRTKP
jgi:limonene 1,2-monooxygenase